MRNRETGVYYRTTDYASFARRLAVVIIDGTVLTIACGGPTFCIFAVVNSNRTALAISYVLSLAVAFLYLAALKRSPLRTIGYRLIALRVVALDGTVPSLSALAMRVVFLPFGPLAWLISLLWIYSDADRQSIHDKLAHTYVIRDGTHPLGSGKVVYNQYDISGYAVVFKEVARPEFAKRMQAS